MKGPFMFESVQLELITPKKPCKRHFLFPNTVSVQGPRVRLCSRTPSLNLLPLSTLCLLCPSLIYSLTSQPLHFTDLLISARSHAVLVSLSVSLILVLIILPFCSLCFLLYITSSVSLSPLLTTSADCHHLL